MVAQVNTTEQDPLFSELEEKLVQACQGYVYNYNLYPQVRCEEHPHALKTGLVGLARIQLEIKLGRFLKEHEIAYHLNKDPLDCSPDNLVVITRADLGEKNRPANWLTPIHCKQCKQLFQPRNSKMKCCSTECANLRKRRPPRIPPERLAELVWEVPVYWISQRIGVSDQTVAKWCKRFGIDKPGRGYWKREYQGINQKERLRQNKEKWHELLEDLLKD